MRITAAAQATPTIAYIREPLNYGYCGTVWVMNPDGRDQRRLTNGGVPGCGRERDHAWSPDGRQIAFVTHEPDPPRLGPGNPREIYVMDPDGSGQRSLPPDDNASEKSPAWSPDGRQVAFFATGLRVVNADGSGLRRLARNGWGDSAPAWSPDGQQIAFVNWRDSNLEIYAVSADGSQQRRL